MMLYRLSYSATASAHWAVGHEFCEKREKKEKLKIRNYGRTHLSYGMFRRSNELKYLLKWQKVAAKIWPGYRVGILMSKYVD